MLEKREIRLKKRAGSSPTHVLPIHVLFLLLFSLLAFRRLRWFILVDPLDSVDLLLLL